MEKLNDYLDLLNQADRIRAKFERQSDVITLNEFRVLTSINKANSIKTTALERDIASQGVSKVVRRLKEKELVGLKKNPHKRKYKIVDLTQKGTEVLNQCNAILENILKT